MTLIEKAEKELNQEFESAMLMQAKRNLNEIRALKNEIEMKKKRIKELTQANAILAKAKPSEQFTTEGSRSWYGSSGVC